MAILVINPGTGPVSGSSLDRAAANIKVYAEDIAKYHNLIVKDIFRLEEQDENGRYCFALDLEKGSLKRRIVVEMPGLPLENVRYMQLPGQNIWDFPRLYVDGSSWVWVFAIHVAHVERDEDQAPANTRCVEKITIHDQSYQCELDSQHKEKCQSTVVLAGYTEKELGPNIWTFVKWMAARRILP